MKSALAAALCCGLALTGGCTRTSDGSIEPVGISLPSAPRLQSGSWWRWSRPAPEVSDAQQFPAAPPEPAVEPDRKGTSRPVSRILPKGPRLSLMTRPIFQAGANQPAKPLTCNTVTGAAGKTRVVCN